MQIIRRRIRGLSSPSARGYRISLVILAASLQVEYRVPHRRDVARALAFHQGKPGSIADRVAPRFLHLGIVPNDAAGRRVFSGISRLPRPCTPALLHTHLASLSSGLKSPLLRTCDYLRLSESTRDYLRLPVTTYKYLRLSVTTYKYLRLSVTTYKYLRLSVTTCDYPLLPATICDYLRLPVTTGDYP
ncbi:hypothetical protein PR048_029076 [Dryococelus australis]|uniref:Uncharacterized protein n=1 Tax=Dryococelus australis TaxID=614101 RepID=A0ABQ9GCC3_9NEOP|nr:hypothetical protein PR048_029076 [Dryococelus australis]